MNAYNELDQAVDGGIWNLVYRLVDPVLETPLDAAAVFTLGDLHLALREAFDVDV